MELGLQGKVALVTGASRGIGRATALELAREGCDIVAAARTAEQLAELADEVRRKYNRRVTTDAADLRDSENVRRLVDAAANEFGRIDIVVNNAGATKRGDFFVLEDADFLDGFALKFHGYVRVTRAAWPHLRKSNGAIVNIIGAGGRTASPDFTIGGSVNAALFNFTKATAQIGIRDGVRVNAINPGSVETDRLKGRIANVAKEQGVDEEEARKRYLAQLGVARFGKPEEIGQLVCFLASPLAANFQGALVDCDSGSTRSI
jgi:NAD(P)-dependent dehydrogenase (short-subunit alcohol dehydrogenase family)